MNPKRIFKYSAVFAAIFLLSIVLSSIWWRFWMAGYLPYPPQIVRNFTSADSEGAYDLVAIDMTIAIAGLIVVILVFIFRLRKTY